MVGGTYAFQYYAGISRTTKDFDIFVRPRDLQRMLDVLQRAGFKTEIAFSHWLAKAHHGDKFIDVIYSSGNGVAEVDDEWFAHAVDEEVLGVPVKLCPAEEMIWSKALIMERERYDGADVAHLFRHCSGLLNWDRLVRRFGTALARAAQPPRPVRLHLSRASARSIPSAVMKDLISRLLAELDVPTRDSKVCQGTLLSRAQYLVDVDEWGYEDARAAPRGNMSEQQIAEWTAAIDKSSNQDSGFRHRSDREIQPVTRMVRAATSRRRDHDHEAGAAGLSEGDSPPPVERSMAIVSRTWKRSIRRVAEREPREHHARPLGCGGDAQCLRPASAGSRRPGLRACPACSRSLQPAA